VKKNVTGHDNENRSYIHTFNIQRSRAKVTSNSGIYKTPPKILGLFEYALVIGMSYPLGKTFLDKSSMASMWSLCSLRILGPQLLFFFLDDILVVFLRLLTD
jgi:hypothetical protein